MATKVINGVVTVESVETLVPIHCGGCGVLFAMNKTYYEERQKDHKTWHCPNGCTRHYSGESAEAKELREIKERLAAEREWARQNELALDQERRSHAATKGQLTKTRKRVQNGVCPDCNRHFANVERHMASKHPGEGLRERRARDGMRLRQQSRRIGRNTG